MRQPSAPVRSEAASDRLWLADVVAAALLATVGVFGRGLLRPAVFTVQTETPPIAAQDPDRPKTAGAPARTAVVVGGGPAGLSAALMLRARNYTVRVVDRLEAPEPADSSVYRDQPERNYNLGLNGRGQSVLQELGALDAVAARSKECAGRQNWSKDGVPSTQIMERKDFPLRCIQRNRLSAVLYELASQDPGIQIEYGVACQGVTWESDGVHVTLGPPAALDDERLEKFDVEASASSPAIERVSPDLLVGADGSRSLVRERMAEEFPAQFQITRYEDTNAQVYKIVPLDLDTADPSKWRTDLNISAPASTGIGVTLEVLPTVEGKGVGTALFKPGNEAVAAADTPEKARKLFEENFAPFLEVIPERAYASFAQQREQRLPTFQYSGPQLHAPRTVLVGDAIHLVKPYFGMGVNSGFDDVRELGKCLDASDDVQRGLEHYSKIHAPNAKALVRISRSFDRGFVFFVLPLILDQLFSKYLPRLFSPNSIRMIQRADLPFKEAARIKRRDRALQAAVLLSGVYLLGRVAWWLLSRMLFRA